VLNRIFSRRLVRAEQSGLDELPDSGIPAALGDVVAFIEGETDDALLADLVWALSLLNWNETPEVPWARQTESQATPSALFNLLRLAFPRSNERKRADLPKVPPVPAIHRHAAAGNGREASRLASRRLRASDMPPAVTEVASSGDTVRRTAAALLFPIAPKNFELVQKAMLRNDPATTAASLSLANALTSLP
jgi:CRISPR-associated protein Csx17